MSKPRFSIFLALSLDGFIADVDGGVEWLNTLPAPEDPTEDYGFAALLNDVDALVMGRNTLDQVLSFGEWPYGDLPVICLTHQPQPTNIPKDARLAFDAGSVHDLVKRWSDQEYEHIYLDGGNIIQSFLKENLIEKMTLTQVPVLLGSGIPLFQNDFSVEDWHLESTTSHDNGFVQRIYVNKKSQN